MLPVQAVGDFCFKNCHRSGQPSSPWIQTPELPRR
jgi:hypothetical protein